MVCMPGTIQGFPGWYQNLLGTSALVLLLVCVCVWVCVCCWIDVASVGGCFRFVGVFVVYRGGC